MLIDTHCHLVSEELREKVLEMTERAQDVGVGKIINIAYDPLTIDLALEQLGLSPILYCALGIQPHDAHLFTLAQAEKIEKIAKAEKRVVAIGEIGLDDYHKICPLEVQKECFRALLQVALAVSLPVVVHVRETHS
ncbi:MAG: TatD family hydrolase, partial [Silvanigrellaceae bacterium]|nr:TatD family hydrolase [Silvanigrellaceae bacterium]